MPKRRKRGKILLAQLFHGLQVQLAAQAGVDPFEVSIDLLVEVVPHLLECGIAPVPDLVRWGRQLGLIRPSTRLEVQVPFVDATWISPAPPEALQPREKARSAQRKCEPGPWPKTQESRLIDGLSRFCWSEWANHALL